MKLDKIALHNFKCFYQTCAVPDLVDRHTADKRIILFGGLNGAGKTTILEAILLCLYGKKNKTLWPTKGAKREDYQNYIVSVTNTIAKTQSLRPELWIEVTLKEIELGGIANTLTVKRSWTIDSDSNTIWDEKLLLSDDEGKEFDFVSPESWETFINELIPYDVSQFFFFDGEKIQDFVKDEDKEFAESLEKVLGISLFLQLRNDLETVRRRILNDYNKNDDIRVRIAKIEAEIAEKEHKIKGNQEAKEATKVGFRHLEERIDEIDLETRRITQVKAESLDEFETQKESLLKEKGGIEEKLFEAIQEDFPFIITAELCGNLLQQLENEKKLKDVLAARETLHPRIEIITRKLFENTDEAMELALAQKSYYAQRLREILEDVLAEKPEGLEETTVLHDLTNGAVEKIRFKINSTKGIVGSLSHHINRLQEIDPKLKKIQQSQHQAGDPEAAKLYEERGKLIEQIEIKKQEIESLLVENDKLADEITSLKRQRSDLEDKAEKTLDMQRQIDYCKKMRATLDDFSHKLRVQKVCQLQDYTLQMWQILAHKKDHVKRIVINPDSQFSISLYGDNNKLLDKTKLSAGEKEILAISLIWALSQLTERNLPIIIDTPLGRLDSLHRINIASRYFPNAGSQVILLSTNTELVGNEYQAIQPFIGQQFLIQRNPESKTSTITKGYFEDPWQKN